MEIAFTPLAQEHLQLVHTWLNKDPVRRWYGERDWPRKEVDRKYGEVIAGRTQTHAYIVELDGTPAGLVQTYMVRDYPKYAHSIGAESDWAGIDYLIGEASFRGRGLAPDILRRFVATTVTQLRDARICVACPHPDNEASVRTATCAGFITLWNVTNDSGEPELLMGLQLKGPR